uniref:Uncharacterized protein n=1 Tax=Arundo donax TaxID=35708 RepID=A0A0A8Y8C0_ARUDO
MPTTRRPQKGGRGKARFGRGGRSWRLPRLFSSQGCLVSSGERWRWGRLRCWGGVGFGWREVGGGVK